MTQYQYHSEIYTPLEQTGGSTAVLEHFTQTLNARAAQGWEFVGVSHLEFERGAGTPEGEVSLGGATAQNTPRVQILVFRRNVQNQSV